MSQTGIRWILAAIVVVVLGGTIVGIGQGGGGGGEGAAAPEATGASSALVALGPVAGRGRDVFKEQGCGGCHRLADAGTAGTIGPDLDGTISADDLATIRQDIVDPGARDTPGYPSGRMPTGYGQQLSKTQLDDLVRYLQAATSGK